MKKPSILTLLLAVISMANIIAQTYDQGIGLRGGATNGITYKHFLSEQDAVEFIGGFQDNGIRVTGLYERHEPALNVDQLFWYYGAGGHVGFYNDDYNPSYREDNDNSSTAIGVDGIGGLEYRIEEIPITLSGEIKPFIEFTDPDIYLWDAGLSIRYMF